MYVVKNKKDWPGLWLPKVKVVDAVEVHVLSVPGKGGLPHAKIQVRCVDSFNDNTALLLHHVQQSVEVTNVPLMNALDNNGCISLFVFND